MLLVEQGPQCIFGAGQNKSLSMLPYSGSNLLTHVVTFAWTFRTSIVRVCLDELDSSFTDNIFAQSAPWRVCDGGGLSNLSLPLALPNIVEYVCSSVVSPARNMTTHASSSPMCVKSHKSPFERTLSPTLIGWCSNSTSLLN